MAAGEPAAGGLTDRRVLLGVTGGIAAYKAAFLCRLLVERGAEIRVVMTAAATRFVGPDTFAALTRHPVHSDVFERADTVLHVRLAHQSEVAVVAPATANALARLALGLADDLLTSTLLEASCPLVVAPAMHTGMWNHPATQEHIRALADRGVVVVGPAAGALAAGDEGIGRMAEPDEILEAVLAVLTNHRVPLGRSVVSPTAGHEPSHPPLSLAGARVVVTAGPTYEPIDAVRFIGNRSSGRMGFILAEQAAARGATVTLVTGPVALPDPAGIRVVRVETAAQMAAAVNERYGEADAVVMAAAVADWRPERPSDQKLKKDAGPPPLALEPTIDILAALGKRKERQVLVGFAAETGDLDREARRKLAEKNLDLIVVNEVGRPGTGFGSDTDRAAILSASGRDAPLRDWTKGELAATVWDWVAELLSARGGGSAPGSDGPPAGSGGFRQESKGYNPPGR
jgi:phosphopantothenoylcysteine decarboxylase/phosphopantothenate--cysteine ligase